MTRGLQQKRRKPVHVSWHIAGLSGGLLIGVAIVTNPALQIFNSPLWLVVALAIAGLAMSRRSRTFVAIAFCAGLLLGLWRGGGTQVALRAYQPHLDQTVSIQGIVNEDVSHGDKGESKLQLRDIRINGQELPGKVWASVIADKKTVIKRGDTLIIHGKLKEGFGNFPASMASASLSSLKTTSDQDAALRFRDRFAEGIRQAIPEPAASLGSGFLTGQHSDLPGNLEDELKAVGLTHAVVASGSNLTILVAFTRKLFGKASKFVATAGGAAMTFGFVLMTGFSPSMTRAGLVTGLSLAAWYYGRRIHPMVLIPFAAAITVILNPSFLWGDIGWCLSFSAFAGVLILAPLIQHYFWGKDRKPGLLLEIFIGTSAAQIATMPVILFSVGTYSSYALLANMLVLPLIPLAMLLTFVAGIAGWAFPAIAQAVGWPATITMEYMLRVIHWVANLPAAQGQLNYSLLALIGSYIALIVAILYMWRRTSHKFGHETALLIGERT